MEIQDFIHLHNVAHYRKLLAEAKDETERKLLAKLLSEEEAKEPGPASMGCSSGASPVSSSG